MNTKNILIIEDDQILLNLLKDKLAKAGYHIILAENGKIGLKLAEEEQPDLVLLDLILPEMDGMAVLEKIRQNASISSMSVIIISNSGQPFEIERAEKLGIEDYLIKTEFDPAEVLEKVDNFFGKKGKKNGSNIKESVEKKYQEEITESKKSPEAEIRETGKSTENINQTKTTVLIIEDDKFLRELISQKLEKEGIKIILAITAEEAFVAMKKERPHLILLDLILPGMSGFEFLEKLRLDRDLSDIPVIVLSNLGEEKDKEAAKKFRVKSFLVKAMSAPNEIVKEIKKVLEQSYL